MNKLLLTMPFGYFIKTRLNTPSAILFHGFAEFLLGCCLMIYVGISPMVTIKSFLLCYFAFISVYEIGYIFNDFVSVRFEKNPRKRLASWNPSNGLIICWVIIRIVVFLGLSYYLQVLNQERWIYFYLVLATVYTLHNSLAKKEYKIFSFISLGFLRFYAPIFIFLPKEFLLLSIPAVFLNYILFRAITYMDSKDLIKIPGRNSLTFKTNYYLIFLPLSLLISILSLNWLSLWLNLYFLTFWVVLLIISKMRLIKVGDLKTD